MLTVHKLHPGHDLLADNDAAKSALEHGIEEVLVVIHRGEVIRVETPPGGVSEFVPEDDWMFAAIRDAFALGVKYALRGLVAVGLAPPGPDDFARDCIPPPGWTWWGDLKPGTVAVDGNPEPQVLLLGTDGAFQDSLRQPCSAVWQSSDGPFHAFKYDPAKSPPFPFVRVLATGLSNAQLVRVATLYGQGLQAIETILAEMGVAQMPSDTRLSDYLASMAPAKRSRAKKVLTAILPANDGEVVRHALIERIVDEGGGLQEVTEAKPTRAGGLSVRFIGLALVLADGESYWNPREATPAGIAYAGYLLNLKAMKAVQP